MLTVKSVDEATRRTLAESYGEPQVQALVMRDDDVEAGGVVYTMTPQEMRLLRFWTKDPFLRDFLLRAALNIGWRRGVVAARCAVSDHLEFLQSEGFTVNGEEAQVEIAAFFNRPCAGASAQ